MFVFVKIWDCHGYRHRAGLAVCMPLTEAWTSTSLTGRCGRIVTLSDENRGTSGVRSPDEHSNKSRTTSCRSGSSCAVWVSSGGTGFSTMAADVSLRPGAELRLFEVQQAHATAKSTTKLTGPGRAFKRRLSHCLFVYRTDHVRTHS